MLYTTAREHVKFHLRDPLPDPPETGNGDAVPDGLVPGAVAGALASVWHVGPSVW